MRNQLFLIFAYKIILGILLIVIILGVARIFMFLSFSDFSTMAGRFKEIGRLFNHGIRYDIRTATIGLAPFSLVGLLLLVWPTVARSYYNKLHVVVTFFCLVAITASVCNYYYYATYGKYFDIFIFGLLEEDTKAVVSSIWNDYPVITCSVGVILTTLIIDWNVRKIFGRLENISWRQWSWPMTISAILLFLVSLSLIHISEPTRPY